MLRLLFSGGSIRNIGEKRIMGQKQRQEFFYATLQCINNVVSLKETQISFLIISEFEPINTIIFPPEIITKLGLIEVNKFA